MLDVSSIGMKSNIIVRLSCYGGMGTMIGELSTNDASRKVHDGVKRTMTSVDAIGESAMNSSNNCDEG